MINLLPPQNVISIKYGRTNAVLRRWLLGIVTAIVGLILIIASGWFYIDRQSGSLKDNLADSTANLKSQNLEQVQKDAAEISADIKVINQVLRKELRFSALIQEIGKVMPDGTVLGSLSLSKVAGAIDLSASAKSYGSAAQIAVNLNDPANGIFSKVDIVSISCDSGGADYKCSATFKALFSPTASTKFLNVPSSGSEL